MSARSSLEKSLKNYLNSVNKSHQGRFNAGILFVDNVQAFIMKLELAGQQNQGKKLQYVWIPKCGASG